MPFHIKKPFILNTSKDVYYKSNGGWTETYADRTVYSSNPSAMMVNNDGKNGGWAGASVVSE